MRGQVFVQYVHLSRRVLDWFSHLIAIVVPVLYFNKNSNLLYVIALDENFVDQISPGLLAHFCVEDL